MVDLANKRARQQLGQIASILILVPPVQVAAIFACVAVLIGMAAIFTGLDPIKMIGVTLGEASPEVATVVGKFQVIGILVCLIRIAFGNEFAFLICPSHGFPIDTTLLVRAFGYGKKFTPPSTKPEPIYHLPLRSLFHRFGSSYCLPMFPEAPVPGSTPLLE